jgi:hypothetical protein
MLFIIKPNPFFSFTTVSGHEDELFVLYDSNGRKINVYRGDKIGSDISPGVYFVIPQNKNISPLRIVKIR